MCELLGMSARRPTDVNHSLALLRPRGGEIGPHADGWGVAFFEDRAARVFKEPVPACESPELLTYEPPIARRSATFERAAPPSE